MEKERVFISKKNGEKGILFPCGGVYRLKVDWGFSRIYEKLEDVFEDWDEVLEDGSKKED